MGNSYYSSLLQGLYPPWMPRRRRRVNQFTCAATGRCSSARLWAINSLPPHRRSQAHSPSFARQSSVAVVKRQIIFTFIGAALGVLTVLRVDPGVLNRLIPILILVVAYILRCERPAWTPHTTLKRSSLVIGCCFAFVIGFYDGFGPGTGSFLIIAFIATFGFDFLIASANAKVLNFTATWLHCSCLLSTAKSPCSTAYPWPAL